MTDITIPPEALEAGARAMCHNAYKHLPEMRDQDTYTPDAEYWLGQARAAFVAMVENWPGCEEDDLGPAYLILPLAQKQEASDAKR